MLIIYIKINEIFTLWTQGLSCMLTTGKKKYIYGYLVCLFYLYFFFFFQRSCIIDAAAYLAKEFSKRKIHFNSYFCPLNKLLFFPSYIWSQNHRTTKQISLISLWTFLLTSFYFSKRINVLLHDCSFPDRRGRELFLKLLKSEALALYKSIPTGYQDCVWKHMW